MISGIFKFTAVLLSSLAIHAINMDLTSQIATGITGRARAEYQRHACGRAVAAIQNFKVIAKKLESSPKRSESAIADTFIMIQNALMDTYGRFYTIEGSYCIDRRTLRPTVTAYRRGPDTHFDSPNFSYRFL